MSFGQFIRDKIKPDVPDLFEEFEKDILVDEL